MLEKLKNSIFYEEYEKILMGISSYSSFSSAVKQIYACMNKKDKELII